MLHEDGLIATLALALFFAALGGFIAARLRLPPLVGYLMAGVAVGPFTPGFIANPSVAGELAEIGVILLMFGVGIHFSLRDLFSVRSIAIPGALFQIAVATLLATLGAVAFGWPVGSGIVLGLAVAVASTVVLLRALVERGALESPHGRIAVGWLIVEDLFIIVVLVMLPPLADSIAGRGGPADLITIGGALAVTTLKVVAFGLLMFLVGGRVIPWLFGQVARTGQRELFTLGVLALALGIAFGSATTFGVSLALGAFLAGAVMSESDLSHQVAADALPMRDAFAVLFFVSVGMLFDPRILLTAPFAVVALVTLIILGKGLAALAIVLAFGYPIRTAITVAVALAQIGEFSFILSALGRELQLLPAVAHDLILAGAIVSITINPLLFRMIEPLERWLTANPAIRRFVSGRAGSLAKLEVRQGEGLRRHAILCGHGRVGSVIAEALQRRSFPYVVVEQDRKLVERIRDEGTPAIYADAASKAILEHAGLARAMLLIVAIPDAAATRRIVEEARAARPDLEILARTHSESEWRYLRAGPASTAIWAEREIAVEMAAQALRRFGVSALEIANITNGLRRR